MAKTKFPKNIRNKKIVRDVSSLEARINATSDLMNVLSSVSDSINKKSLKRQIKFLRKQYDTQQERLDHLKKILEINELIKKTSIDTSKVTGVIKQGLVDAGNALKDLGTGILSSIDDIMDTFFGPLWTFTKRFAAGIGKFGVDLFKSIFGIGIKKEKIPKDQIALLAKIREQLIKQSNVLESMYSGDKTFRRQLAKISEIQGEQAFERNKDLLEALGKERKKDEGFLTRRFGRVWKALKRFGGFIASLFGFGAGIGGKALAMRVLGRTGLIGAIVTAIIMTIKDFTKGFKEKGVIGGLVSLITGKFKTQASSIFANMGKWASYGFIAGFPFGGPIGGIVGGLIGAGVGALLYWIGYERVEKFLIMVKNLSGKIYNVAIQPVIDTIWRIIKKGITDPIALLKDVWNYIINPFSPKHFLRYIFKFYVQSVIWVGQEALELISKFGPKVINEFKDAFSILWEKISTVGKKIKDFISNVSRTIYNGLVTTGKFYIDMYVSLFKHTYQLFITVGDKIKEGLLIGWKFIANIPNLIYSFVIKIKDWFIQLPIEVGKSLTDVLPSVVESIKNSVLEIFNKLNPKNWFKGIFEKLRGKGTELPKVKEVAPTAVQPTTFSRADLSRMYQTGPIIVPSHQVGGEVAETGIVTVHRGEEIRPANIVKFEADTLQKVGDSIISEIQTLNDEIKGSMSREGGRSESITINTVKGIDDLGLLFINSVLI